MFIYIFSNQEKNTIDVLKKLEIILTAFEDGTADDKESASNPFI